MQIDFHHAVTYVLARLAGFAPAQADIVAYSAQYVDDAVTDGGIEFDNGAMYALICSAHKMLDYRNFEALADHLAWMPFHFLPGNGGLPAGQDPQGSFIRKLQCVPNSPIARDMVIAVIRNRDRRSALHRLGIAMHTYADTWAHQGFVGVRHDINHASAITGPTGSHDHALMDRIKNYFVDVVLPLGHGTVLSNPDKPWLVWGYTNGLGERILRNNPADYMDACDHMCRAMQCFRAGDIAHGAPGLPARDRAVLAEMLNGLTEDDETKRHAEWLAAVGKGAFSFGAETVAYRGEGEGSWKHQALGAMEEPSDGYRYTPAFLRSDWKLFHDALQAHRLEVTNHILPEYGICVA
jgi:hypothetical protein